MGVTLGWTATTTRWSRPPAAAGSWYLATRPATAPASSSAKAARSAAEAKRTSPSIAKVATRWRALAAPVSRSPTSRTSREATARSQDADTRSGARSGSGWTAARAAGEITYDAAVARMTRSVQLPLRRSSTSSTRPCRSSARRW